MFITLTLLILSLFSVHAQSNCLGDFALAKSCRNQYIDFFNAGNYRLFYKPQFHRKQVIDPKTIAFMQLKYAGKNYVPYQIAPFRSSLMGVSSWYAPYIGSSFFPVNDNVYVMVPDSTNGFVRSLFGLGLSSFYNYPFSSFNSGFLFR